ncbi:hypothetical protein PCANC_18606 [Puccinia coronata f. sp. avenae]|uniref:Heme haloperoxidase family profile domain-containing protein n=1 Tax=Puccinia coronata f. sp. avenae TaxID=200324 RepID=A0A2N5UHL2_9BASI|nr:hypothetical protein PCASD_20026 [Puccinia coronata f. sp. avenae]PLW37239.1 hypothetical protein PCANC_18606 [Puccinia coronata f. sp. avenae]
MSPICSEVDPLLPSGGNEAVGITSTPEEEHSYSRRMMGCPCPAIAAMINHSYLNPRDDEDPISMYKLIKALRTCYHLSFPFAILFVLAANLRLGTIRSGGFTLKHLKKHGVIEHDASITRYNESEGDNLNPQCGLVDEFIDGIKFPPGIKEAEKMVTLDDYARKRIELEDKLTSFLPQQPKFRIHLLGIGEASLALQVFADKTSPVYARGLCARADWLRIWYKEERFPLELGWENHRPGYKITLIGLIRTVRKLLQRTKELEDGK